MSFDSRKVPHTWETVTIGGIADSIQYGHTASAVDRETGPRFLRITDIQDGQVHWESVPSCNLTEAELAKYQLKPGDLVFARTGATTGKSFLIRHCPQAIFASYLIRVRVSREMDERYLALFFQSPEYWRQIEGGKRGVGQPNVNGTILGQVQFNLPPLAEQRRIIGKLEELFSELDAGVENLKKARAQLAVYRQALLKHAFEGKLTAEWRAKHAAELESAEQLLARIRAARDSDFNPITKQEAEVLPVLPINWTHGRFGEFIQSMNAGKSFSCDERRPHPDEVGVAKVSAVTWGEYLEEESKTCVDPAKINASYFIHEGDFLLSRANTIDLVGASVIVKRVTQRIMLSDKTLRLSIEGLPQEYLLYYLRSRQGRREIMSRSTGNQESMRNIGQDRIRSILVPMCSPMEAAKIVELIEAHLSPITALEADIDQNLQRAEALRQSILKKAFAGELVQQDPADEPAAVLLARIRAEHEAQAASPKLPKTRTKKA